MFCKPAISVTQLSKCYQLYHQPHDRLKQFLWRGRKQFYREFWALRDVSFEVGTGEVLGVIGRNGSGKSTLLQLVCGTLSPTRGEVAVNGRIAALLELGAGFNPEFSGRENIWMNATILGLSDAQIAERIEAIIDFSGIRDFIDQPVKTYSSGMYVRLAFAVATSVDPDILVIDEALSVGDGAFARKSFDRIMQLRDAGKTILFCSHSLFQVESLCNRAIWLNNGQIMASGEAASVVSRYQAFLDQDAAAPSSAPHDEGRQTMPRAAPQGHARLHKVIAYVDGEPTAKARFISCQSTLAIRVDFASDPALPPPTLGITLQASDGRTISSAASWEDRFILPRNSDGSGSATLTFERAPLLKGDYFLNIYLLCEKSIHLYDSAQEVAELNVRQDGLLQGYFVMPHRWNPS
ncbi:MAG: ABC transporter ATP-binding protein [Methylomicrobium sp.]